MKPAFLLAEAGATKTTWAWPVSSGWMEHKGPGINPNYLSYEELVQRFRETGKALNIQPLRIHYFGAGLSSVKNRNAVSMALREIWPDAEVETGHDMLAAALALCGNDAGIACIIGTGANACKFNGEKIVQNVAAPGYILGDEGSGAWLGKRMLSDFIRKRLPENLHTHLCRQFYLNEDLILEAVYLKPEAGKWMATFAQELQHFRQEFYVQELLAEGFEKFIFYHVLPLNPEPNIPVHVTGSVAHGFREEWEKQLYAKQLLPGKNIQAPLSGLIQYYMQKNALP